MNNNNFTNNKQYYGKQDFPGTPLYVGNNVVPNQQTAANYSTELPMEQSYIENILRLNKGKLATLYFSYPDSVEWRDRKYTGIIEAAGRDHIILSDPKTGRWYLLLMIYLNYADFDEKINYSPTFYIPNQGR